jgi:uncharacterized membrane protein
MLLAFASRKEAQVRPISIAGQPLYAIFLPVAVVCFVGALAADLSYLASDGNLLWLNFSDWLLAAGLLFGAIALLLMLIDALRGAGWAAALMLVCTWIVELFSSLIHARDGWSAVVPTGLVLSVIGAVLVLLSAWLSRSARDVEMRRR